MFATIVTAILLIFSVGPIPAFSAKCNPEDKRALIKIKNFWGDPYLLASWTTSSGCCDWYLVKCDDRTDRVIGLDFSTDTNLSGTIPPAVAELPYLSSLTFHKLPNLVGPVIPEIGRITNLNFLRMDWNGLSGPVPAFLATLKNLEYINLSFNRFTGTIPPVLATMPSLDFLRLDRNQLTGGIPAEFANLRPDFYLFLSHNGLTGSIPKSLGNVDFNTFDVSRNQLTGDASFLFGASKSAFTIDLSRNMLEFDLSKVQFPEKLGQLDLNHNAVYGTIPKQITKLDNLQSFNVSYNRLCGEIPTGGDFSRFDESSFIHNRCLCGKPLPPCKESNGLVGEAVQYVL